MQWTRKQKLRVKYDDTYQKVFGIGIDLNETYAVLVKALEGMESDGMTDNEFYVDLRTCEETLKTASAAFSNGKPYEAASILGSVKSAIMKAAELDA